MGALLQGNGTRSVASQSSCIWYMMGRQCCEHNVKSGQSQRARTEPRVTPAQHPQGFSTPASRGFERHPDKIQTEPVSAGLGPITRPKSRPAHTTRRHRTARHRRGPGIMVRKKTTLKGGFEKMVGRAGFEPATNWLKANCSTD